MCLSFWKCKGGAHTPETVVIEFGVTSEVAENFTLCVCVCVCVVMFCVCVCVCVCVCFPFLLSEGGGS